MTGSPPLRSVDREQGQPPSRYPNRNPTVTGSTDFRTPVPSTNPPLRFRERVNARAGTADLLVFRVGDERFAVDLQAVEETVESPGTHTVPESSATVVGVFAHGDQFIPLHETAAGDSRRSRAHVRQSVAQSPRA